MVDPASYSPESFSPAVVSAGAHADEYLTPSVRGVNGPG